MENNLKNLPPFIKGEIVVANCTYQQIIKGEKYTVHNCFKTKCNKWKVELIGVTSPAGAGTLLRCRDCFEIRTDSGLDVYYSHRFDKSSESPFPSLTFKEVIEKEKVLTCNN